MAIPSSSVSSSSVVYSEALNCRALAAERLKKETIISVSELRSEASNLNTSTADALKLCEQVKIFDVYLESKNAFGKPLPREKLEPLLENLPSDLTKIKIRGPLAENFTIEHARLLREKCPNLTSLSINFGTSTEMLAILAEIPNFPKLQSLHLIGDTAIPQAVLDRFLVLQPQLTTLRLQDAYNHPDNVVPRKNHIAIMQSGRPNLRIFCIEAPSFSSSSSSNVSSRTSTTTPLHGALPYREWYYINAERISEASTEDATFLALPGSTPGSSCRNYKLFSGLRYSFFRTPHELDFTPVVVPTPEMLELDPRGKLIKSLCDQTQEYVRSLNLECSTWPNRGDGEWEVSMSRNRTSKRTIDDLARIIRKNFKKANGPLSDLVEDKYISKEESVELSKESPENRSHRILIAMALKDKLADCTMLSHIAYDFAKDKASAGNIPLAIHRSSNWTMHRFLVLGDPTERYLMICDVWARQSFFYCQRDTHLRNYKGVDDNGKPITTPFDITSEWTRREYPGRISKVAALRVVPELDNMPPGILDHVDSYYQ